MVKMRYRYCGGQEYCLFARFKGEDLGPNLSACVRPGFGLCGHINDSVYVYPILHCEGETVSKKFGGYRGPAIGRLFTSTRSAGLRAAGCCQSVITDALSLRGDRGQRMAKAGRPVDRLSIV